MPKEQNKKQTARKVGKLSPIVVEKKDKKVSVIKDKPKDEEPINKMTIEHFENTKPKKGKGMFQPVNGLSKKDKKKDKKSKNIDKDFDTLNRSKDDDKDNTQESDEGKDEKSKDKQKANKDEKIEKDFFVDNISKKKDKEEDDKDLDLLEKEDKKSSDNKEKDKESSEDKEEIKKQDKDDSDKDDKEEQKDDKSDDQDESEAGKETGKDSKKSEDEKEIKTDDLEDEKTEKEETRGTLVKSEEKENKDAFKESKEKDASEESEDKDKEETDKDKEELDDKKSEDEKTDDKEVTKSKNKKSKTGKWYDFLHKSVGGQKDADFIIENLSLLLSSGINIVSSLEAIKGETKNKALKERIEQLKIHIEDGSSLWRALEKLDLAQKNTIALIKIGEESGKLTENLKVVASQQEKDRSFKQKVITAMMYPVLVLSMTVIIGVGIAWFILPRLTAVFSSLKLDLPLITKIVIWLGDFLSKWGIIVVPAFILLLVAGLYILFFNEKTKHYGQALLFKIPGIKGLLMEIELARFGYIMGQLLDAGLPISESLNSLVETTTNFKYKEIFSEIKKNVDDGVSFKSTFAKIKKINTYIPIGVQQMIISGEQSGNLVEVLKKVAEIYEEKSDFSTKNLAVIIEPILLFIVWAGVLIVALAVIIPIYSLVGGIGQASRPEQTQDTPPETVTTATASPTATVSPPVTPTITPTPTSASIEEVKKSEVEILSTETGYLNVRNEPSVNGSVIAQVNPGEVYTFTKKEGDWYEIKINNDTTGWVFGEYVKEI